MLEILNGMVDLIDELFGGSNLLFLDLVKGYVILILSKLCELVGCVMEEEVSKLFCNF